MNTPDDQILSEARMLAVETELIYRCAQHLLAKLTDNANGYPTRASGSIGGSGGSEVDDYGEAVTYTSTERAALSPDEARRTKERYANTLREARKRLIEPLNITALWLQGVDVKPTEDAAPSNDIWCDNHIKYGQKEPRWQRNKVCRFCYEVNADRGDYPTQRLCDLRSRKSRISMDDLERLMPKAEPAKGKKTKRKKAA